MLSNKLFLGGIVALALFAGGQRQASAQTNVTFGQFVLDPLTASAPNPFVFSNSGVGGTLSASTHVRFQYNTANGYGAPLMDIPAMLTLSGTAATPAQTGLGYDFQSLQNVSLSIVADVPGTRGRTNLLSLTGGTALLLGVAGGNTAHLVADTDIGSSVGFTSEFLDFSNTVSRSLDFSFSSLTPGLALGSGGFLKSFSAAGTGTFASSASPIRINAVPEPGVTALLGGLGVVGTVFGFRRRRK